ncbi:hypothetical protein SASPL_149508 [Salvia splendens]|uniref:Uncharacterized protein n=1 Tax=Salvia splendens TaxID=180675 RepID=A0A8X8WCP4_SALSN|nr:hypothetical protein SASPL_149508 [Salvia splendens]
MHPLAAAAMLGAEIKTKHKSHPPHLTQELAILSLCDACGEKHEDADSGKFNPVRTRLELIQLPDDELNTFPSLEIRTYSQRNQAHSIGDEDNEACN